MVMMQTTQVTAEGLAIGALIPGLLDELFYMIWRDHIPSYMWVALRCVCKAWASAIPREMLRDNANAFAQAPGFRFIHSLVPPLPEEQSMRAKTRWYANHVLSSVSWAPKNVRDSHPMAKGNAQSQILRKFHELFVRYHVRTHGGSSSDTNLWRKVGTLYIKELFTHAKHAARWIQEAYCERAAILSPARGPLPEPGNSLTAFYTQLDERNDPLLHRCTAFWDLKNPWPSYLEVCERTTLARLDAISWPAIFTEERSAWRLQHMMALPKDVRKV